MQILFTVPRARRLSPLVCTVPCIVALTLCLVWFALSASSFALPELGTRDIAELRAFVQRESSEPVVSIERMPGNLVSVSVGHADGPLSGSGEVYIFRRSFFGWRLVTRGSWVA